MQKWAEEGFAIVRVSFSTEPLHSTIWDIGQALELGVATFKSLLECDVKDKFAVLSKLSGTSSLMFQWR
jgi:hypothetical protein